MALSEFELIRRYFGDPARPRDSADAGPGAGPVAGAGRVTGTRRDDVVLGVGDDGAILRPPAGMDLVAVTDTLIEGVHFPVGSAPASIGHRALAVNLSDVAAMGAAPAWALLALTLPQADEAWLEAFADGFGRLARAHGVALVGGDTTSGALVVTVQVLGFVPTGRGLRRAGGRPGDWVFVSGTPGDAAAGLALEMGAEGPGGLDEGWLRDRFLFPAPRVALGTLLRPLASACIDVSDIGKYVIIKEVGRGSTGIVYLCRTTRTTGATSRSRSTTIERGRSREGRASRARCSCPRRTWSGCCSTRTSCRSTTRARRRALLHRHRARARRAHAGVVLQAGQPAAHRRRRRDRLQVREGAALRALARRDPPRHQAVEHHADAGRQRRADHRLRHRAGRGLGDLAHRGHRRQPELHVARAGAVARDHQPLGPLFARRGDVRAADRLSGRSAPATSPSCCTRSSTRRRRRSTRCAPTSRRSSRTSVATAMQKEPDALPQRARVRRGR
jgi:hypothetical protein